MPKIVLPKSTKNRAYVSFSFNGKRYREYNGNRINLNLNPNQFDNSGDKKRLLQALQYEFTKALKNGWDPDCLEQEKPKLKDALAIILDEKLSSNLCDLYKRNLKAVNRMFIASIPNSCLNDIPDNLPFKYVEDFLNQFRTSERNYINRRRCLGTIFNEMIRKGFVDKNIVKQTKPAKAKAKLHAPYEGKELKDCIEYLKLNHPNLYLCCVLTYGCLLRPHHEIRILKLKHFKNDYSEIRLSGSENKSKRIRTVYVPSYIQDILKERFKGVTDSETNLFTLTENLYSVGYFNMMWTKAKPKMIKGGIIKDNQTIYSFRHTAVINVYRKTKDLHILQQLLQHSNMIVTLNYLRGLGEINEERLRDVLPEL